jgi:hypothetical protein
MKEKIEFTMQNVSDRTGFQYKQVLWFLRNDYIQGRIEGGGRGKKREGFIPSQELTNIITGKNKTVLGHLGIDHIPSLETFDHGTILVKTSQDVIEKCGNRKMDKPSRYHYAIKTDRCPRCFSFSYKEGKCPECGWPHDLKKPAKNSDFEWNMFIEKARITRRKEYIIEMAKEAVKKARKEGKLFKPKKCDLPDKGIEYGLIRPSDKIVFDSNHEIYDFKGRLEAHHWSYEPENWLDVIWCCPRCHKELQKLQKFQPPLPLWTNLDIEIKDVSEIF